MVIKILFQPDSLESLLFNVIFWVFIIIHFKAQIEWTLAVKVEYAVKSLVLSTMMMAKRPADRRRMQTMPM